MPGSASLKEIQDWESGILFVYSCAFLSCLNSVASHLCWLSNSPNAFGAMDARPLIGRA